MEKKKLSYHLIYNGKRKLKLKELGICVNCGKTKASIGHVLCDACLLKRRIHARNNLNEINQLIDKQKNTCSICGKEMKKANIDHCHVTGALRGLICPSCNVGLGMFKDNPTSLRNAALYLEKISPLDDL